jgi:hypothetical protein
MRVGGLVRDNAYSVWDRNPVEGSLERSPFE